MTLLFFSKVVLVSLFLSQLSPLFTPSVEEDASYKRDCLSKNTSSKSKLNHPNLTKVVSQQP
jgi:hypothetical protein